MITLFCSVGAVEAALSPLWQSVAEIQSLIGHPDLGSYLESADAIVSLTRTEDGYEVVTNKHILQAHINYLPQKMPGPAHFTWTFSIRPLA